MNISKTTRPYIFSLTLIAMIWGSSFLFMRVLAPVLGPIWTAQLRLTISSIVFYVYFLAIRFSPDWSNNWKHYFVVGLINAALPFSLYSFASMFLPASFIAVTNSCAALFSAVFSFIWLDEEITRRTVIGAGLGTLGVAVLTQINIPNISHSTFALATAASLTAAMCYALSAVYVKKHASHIPAIGLTGGSQFFAALMLLPIGYFSPIRGTITPVIVSSIIALGVICTAFAFALYYKIVKAIGPTKALTVAYIVPIFGILESILFLNEKMTEQIFLGALTILTGIWFVLGRRAKNIPSANRRAASLAP